MERKVKTAEQALSSLQRTCSRMERTKSDIRRSLLRYGIVDSEAEAIIHKLEEDRFIDEKRYASSFVREKLHLQKWSRRRIFQALALKGIPEKYILDAIDENMEEFTEKENLSTILEKKYKSISSTVSDRYELRRKLFSYAANKGYDIDEINYKLDEICKK